LSEYFAGISREFTDKMLENGEPKKWERVAAVLASLAALILAIVYALFG
jgi:hypothetical protein